MTSTHNPDVHPIKSKNRIQYLDILRGIAILFIFIANIYVFCGWEFTTSEVKTNFNGHQADRIIEFLTKLFVDGKWYSIFSILFGIGFVIQYENIKNSGRSFNSFFSRRMLGLLFFGFCHLFFIWMGDILALYALLGFVLIFFQNTSNKMLLRWACFLLIMPIIHLLIMVGTNTFYPLALFESLFAYLDSHGFQGLTENGEPNPILFFAMYLDNESWKELFTINWATPRARLALLLMDGRFFKVLACFLLGIWAGRKILQENLLENKKLLTKIMKWGFLIGIPMNILMAYSRFQQEGIWQLIDAISYALGVVPLACAYAAAIALYYQKAPRLFNGFAPIGRMALSNYLFQSIIAIILYYGIGFGFAFEIPLWNSILLVILIFAGQMIFSKYWLQYFRYGPLEWIWRMMTYGKYIALIRKNV